MGFAYVDFPLYRGAASRKSYVLPTPYVQYHGKFLQADRDQVRGLIYKGEGAELDLDFNGSPPVNSDDADIRRGMPDLDPTFEIGPRLNLHLWKNADRHHRLDLLLPVRAVFGVSTAHVNRVGWLAQPKVNLDLDRIVDGWNLGLQGSFFYGDRDYHAFLYGVAPEYATSARPAYSAEGGYGGKQFLASLSRRRGDVWMGAFLKWDDMTGAVFAHSALVQSRQQFSAGFMVAWVFSKSDKLVEVRND